MKFPTTKSIIASLAISSSVLGMPTREGSPEPNARNSPNLSPRLSPRVATTELGGTSRAHQLSQFLKSARSGKGRPPATRAGSGSRRSLPRFTIRRDSQNAATGPLQVGGLIQVVESAVDNVGNALKGLGIPIPILVREPSAEGGAVKQATIDDDEWEEGSGYYRRNAPAPPSTPANSPVEPPVSPPTNSTTPLDTPKAAAGSAAGAAPGPASGVVGAAAGVAGTASGTAGTGAGVVGGVAGGPAGTASGAAGAGAGAAVGVAGSVAGGPAGIAAGVAGGVIGGVAGGPAGTVAGIPLAVASQVSQIPGGVVQNAPVPPQGPPGGAPVPGASQIISSTPLGGVVEPNGKQASRYQDDGDNNADSDQAAIVDGPMEDDANIDKGGEGETPTDSTTYPPDASPTYETPASDNNNYEAPVSAAEDDHGDVNNDNSQPAPVTTRKRFSVDAMPNHQLELDPNDQ